MSQERLLNLRNKLITAGWKVQGKSGSESIPALLEIELQEISWRISHSPKINTDAWRNESSEFVNALLRSALDE